MAAISTPGRSVVTSTTSPTLSGTQTPSSNSQDRRRSSVFLNSSGFVSLFGSPTQQGPGAINMDPRFSPLLQLALKDYRSKFPPPPGYLAGTLEPTILNGLQSVYMQLCSGSRDGTDEGFIRVTTLSRGGVWCYGRILRCGGFEMASESSDDDKEEVQPNKKTKAKEKGIILAVVEGCSAFADMLYLVNQSIYETFGAVV
jgi:hypothetical protein